MSLCFFLALKLPGEFFSLLDYGFFEISGKTCLRYTETQSCLLQCLHYLGSRLGWPQDGSVVIHEPRPVGTTNHFHPAALRVPFVIIF